MAPLSFDQLLDEYLTALDELFTAGGAYWNQRVAGVEAASQGREYQEAWDSYLHARDALARRWRGRGSAVPLAQLTLRT